MAPSPSRSPPKKKHRALSVSHKQSRAKRRQPKKSDKVSVSDSVDVVQHPDDDDEGGRILHGTVDSPLRPPITHRVTLSPTIIDVCAAEVSKKFCHQALRQHQMSRQMKLASFKVGFRPDTTAIYRWIRECHDDDWPLPRLQDDPPHTAYPDRASFIFPHYR